MNSFEKIRGIGPQTAKNLVEHGFADIAAIARAAVADLASVPGFSVARAEKTIEAAKDLMASADQAPSRKKTSRASSRPAAKAGEAGAGAGDIEPGEKKKLKKDKNEKKDKKEKKKKDKKRKKKK